MIIPDKINRTKLVKLYNDIKVGEVVIKGDMKLTIIEKYYPRTENQSRQSDSQLSYDIRVRVLNDKGIEVVVRYLTWLKKE